MEDIFNMTPEQISQLEAMKALYQDWNAKINVVSRKDIDALYEHHILHSLAIGAYLKLQQSDIFSAFEKGVRVLDLGTGGGFPGIPLAILFPKTRFTLCDSIGKKIKVAQAVADSLGLKNVQTVNERAESLHETFDYIVSRAVAPLDEFYPWVKGKYRSGILYLKGGDVNEEIANMMGRYHLKEGSVHTWPIDSWIQDDYYKGKLVIFISKA